MPTTNLLVNAQFAGTVENPRDLQIYRVFPVTTTLAQIAQWVLEWETAHVGLHYTNIGIYDLKE